MEFEPGNIGFAVRSDDHAGDDDTSTYERDPEILTSCLVVLERNGPDLAAMVAAWPALPEPVKAGILAMVRAAIAAADTNG